VGGGATGTPSRLWVDGGRQVGLVGRCGDEAGGGQHGRRKHTPEDGTRSGVEGRRKEGERVPLTRDGTLVALLQSENMAMEQALIFSQIRHLTARSELRSNTAG
jgi:hypothetical protein